MRGLRLKITGGALASTLLVVLFLVIFGFTLATLATFDLRTVARNGQRQMAFEAAQAGLDAVIGELSRDPRVGTSNEVFESTLSDGSKYRVSFNSSGTEPWSLNNLGSLVGGTGYNTRTVPPLHASIFAQGESPNGETALVECLVRLEAIPYAVAGTGRVTLNNTQVSGARNLGGPEREAHVYSGSTAADSLRLTLASRVSGDARSVGGIQRGPLATVVGDQEPYRSPDQLPDLNIETYKNDTVPGVDYRPGGALVATLSGPVYIDGDATFTAVTLNNATVYVDGDLDVLAILGTGTVFVNGSTNFLASINITGSNRLTLFSEGDINFNLLSVVQGVVFTHGNVTSALALQVSGAVYAVNETDPSKGNVNLGLLSQVVHVSELTSFASFWLGIGGEADAIRVYWRRLR